MFKQGTLSHKNLFSLQPTLSDSQRNKTELWKSQGALCNSEQPCFQIQGSWLLINARYRQLNTFPLPSILERSPSHSIKSSTLVKVNLEDARGSHKAHASQHLERVSAAAHSSDRFIHFAVFYLHFISCTNAHFVLSISSIKKHQSTFISISRELFFCVKIKALQLQCCQQLGKTEMTFKWTATHKHLHPAVY